MKKPKNSFCSFPAKNTQDLTERFKIERVSELVRIQSVKQAQESEKRKEEEETGGKKTRYNVMGFIPWIKSSQLHVHESFLTVCLAVPFQMKSMMRPISTEV